MRGNCWDKPRMPDKSKRRKMQTATKRDYELGGSEAEPHTAGAGERHVNGKVSEFHQGETGSNMRKKPNRPTGIPRRHIIEQNPAWVTQYERDQEAKGKNAKN